MSVLSRLAALERHQPASGRFIVVSPCVEPGDDPGSIEQGATSSNYSLKIPREHASDPMVGLSDEQRAFIRPTDTVIVIEHGEAA